MKTQKIYFLLCVVTLFLSLFSCNSDDDVVYDYSDSVRVTSFSLAENDSVLVNLDTVFFTIDLNRGLIYNADSLPKGTDVSALIANITFDNVSQALIHVDRGDPDKNYTIDYIYAPSDSIDFTGKVSLEVISESGASKKTYSLKVNVHEIEPDSLYWTGRFGVKSLPCGKDVTVDAQKSLYYKKSVYSWVSVGTTTTLYTTENPYGDEWVAQELALSFTPDLLSLQATGEILYMLSQAGELFSSEDGVNWSSTGSKFHSLQGTWKDRVLGVVLDNGVYKHGYYTSSEGYVELNTVDNNFPITGSSPMVTFESLYDLGNPQSIMVGGRTQNDKLTGATWGYDGKTWAQLQGSITPCEGALLFPYFTFSTNEYWQTTQYSTWIVIGGRDAQGVTDSVYVSLNNGNTWSTAPVSLEMPDYIKPRAFASVMVVEADYNAPQDNAWKMMPAMPFMREATRASNYKIPYIYMFGGEDNSGRIYNEIWRGAIGRLRYPPIP